MILIVIMDDVGFWLEGISNVVVYIFVVLIVYIYEGKN